MDRLQSLSIKVDVALTREFLVDEMCQLSHLREYIKAMIKSKLVYYSH